MKLGPTGAAVLLAAIVTAEGRRLEAAPAGDEVDPALVDRAIKKGVAFLKGCDALVHHDEAQVDSDELLLWTFVHAGVPGEDPAFKKLFDKMMSDPLERTYSVSLQAMILEELDRVRHQDRIYRCAKFLVDNQCTNGQWSYGRPVAIDVPPPAREIPQATPGSAGGGPGGASRSDRRGKPMVVRKIAVVKTGTGPEEGDNSNSQYAALGLRACHDAGVGIPREVTALAEKWWRDSMHDAEGGGPYGGRGWCYGPKDHGHPAYGSMTAGAVGSLAIYDYLHQGEGSWRKDRHIALGLQWMAAHFSVTCNPGPYEHAENNAANSAHHLYYYLYALERAGILCGIEKLGKARWYEEGAKMLLSAQKGNGSWSGPIGDSPWIDTCFAILFLRRATRPLDVASVDRLKSKDK